MFVFFARACSEYLSEVSHRELLKLYPRQKYLALWQRTLNKSGDTCSPNLKDYRIVLDIHVPVQTASLSC